MLALVEWVAVGKFHAELVVRVIRVRSWGIEMVTDRGEIGFVDAVKLGSTSDTRRSLEKGKRLDVVVLDES